MQHMPPSGLNEDTTLSEFPGGYLLSYNSNIAP